jgi:hypothetical protein
MTVVKIRAALELALDAMSPSLQTAWENAEAIPVQGTAYQRAFIVTAPPQNIEMTGKIHREQGYLQVSLLYPLGEGPAAAATRAELIRATFYNGATFTNGGVSVIVDGTPEIGPAFNDDGRYILPVRIRFYSYLQRS